MQNIQIAIAYEKRRLQSEVKHRGGTFDPHSKTWLLPDTPANRVLADAIALPVAAATDEERVRNIALGAVAMLNAVKGKKYRLVEWGENIVIKAEALTP